MSFARRLNKNTINWAEEDDTGAPGEQASAGDASNEGGEPRSSPPPIATLPEPQDTTQDEEDQLEGLFYGAKYYIYIY